MDEAGVDKAISLAWYWQQHATCKENFAWQKDLSSEFGERLLFFAPFNANGGDAALELITDAFENGFYGIGELNPPAQGYAYDHPTFDAAIRICIEHQKPINLHVTEPAGRNYPGKIDTPFHQLQALASRHPDATFIFAHLGGLLPFYEMNRTARADLKNVYYDTAAVPLLYDKAIYRRVADAIGIERILFGTDYPLKTYPKKPSPPDFAMQLAEIRSEFSTTGEPISILGENASHILGITPSAE